MADGCLLIVDAQEGPMPQTKFVLQKALASGLKPIVVINKIDKVGSRIKDVENELADLFLELAIHEDQLHYPVYFAIGRAGKAWAEMPADPEAEGDLSVLFDAIIADVPAPSVELDGPFQMLVTALRWDSYKGKYAIGRVNRGSVKPGDSVVLCKKDGTQAKATIDHVFISHGITIAETPTAIAGDIVQLTGVGDAQIGETVADSANPEALPILEVEAPTLKIYLGPNTSPVKGTEGDFTTSRQIGDRLNKELETNVGLELETSDVGFLVSGRGELHLSVLIETLRREGFEFEVGRPQVVTKIEDGKTMEPIEELTVEVPADFVGAVQMELGTRRAMLKEQFISSKGVTKLVYELPTRSILGLRNVLMTNTKGAAVLNSLMVGYQPQGQALQQLRNGALVSWVAGSTTAYSLQKVEERGTCFVGPGVKVYAGQIIGLNNRSEDMDINVCKGKQLTNMRTSSSDGVVQLMPPTIFSLEECIDFIEDDELLEVTPVALRLRKRELDPNKRKKN
jgi:GTP-binding protein